MGNSAGADCNYAVLFCPMATRFILLAFGLRSCHEVHGVTNPYVSKRAPREFRNWRVQGKSETGRIRFRRVQFELSEFFGPHRVPERELSEFLSPYNLCAKANSPSFFVSQSSPSLAQNSVSSLFRNSTLETAFCPFPRNPPTLCQPFANPLPTRRQPFANPLPTFSANPSPTPSVRGPQAPI